MALLWGIWGNRGLIPTRSQPVQTSVFLQERRCHVHGLRSLIGPGAAKYVAAGLCCFAFCLMIPLILSNLIAAKLDSMTGR